MQVTGIIFSLRRVQGKIIILIIFLTWSLAQNPPVWIYFLCLLVKAMGLNTCKRAKPCFYCHKSQVSSFHASGRSCHLLSSSTVTIPNFTWHCRALENVFFSCLSFLVQRRLFPFSYLSRTFHYAISTSPFLPEDETLPQYQQGVWSPSCILIPRWWNPSSELHLDWECYNTKTGDCNSSGRKVHPVVCYDPWLVFSYKQHVWASNMLLENYHVLFYSLFRMLLILSRNQFWKSNTSLLTFK